MKKLSFDTLLFKVVFLFVLFFGGISFEVKAQEVLAEHKNSVKVIFDRAVLDIAKVASEAIINSSKTIKANEKAANIESIKYQDWEAFKNSTAKYGTIKSDVADKYKIVEWTYDISKDSISIKKYIKELISNTSIKQQESELEEILKGAINKVNEINIAKVVEQPTKDTLVTQDITQSTASTDIPIDEGREITPEEQSIIPKEYQEYVLLASLGLGVLNLLILLALWNSISSIKKNSKILKNPNVSTHQIKTETKSNEKYITENDFKEFKQKLETVLNTTLQNFEADLQKKYKAQPQSQPNVYKEPKQNIPPTTHQETPIKETKYAKYPSSENGFSSSSLKAQNDDEAIYIISTNGNEATFEINQNNSEAMQRAMNDTTSFLSKACEFLDVPQNNKRPQTDTKGTLQLIDNIWQIKQKSKIKFV